MRVLRSLLGRWVLALTIGFMVSPLAKANDVTLLDTVLNTDYLSAGAGGLRSNGVGRIVVQGLSGQVNRAYLYWHGPTQSPNLNANARVRLNNTEVIGSQIGFSDDNCWNFLNSQAYRADVTGLVQAKGNGNYDLAQFNKPGGIEVNGASLVIFYQDGNPDNNRDVIIFDGNDSNIPNRYDSIEWDVFLGGIRYTGGHGFLELHVSDGQKWRDSPVLVNREVLVHGGEVFEGNSVPSMNPGPVDLGALWDIKRMEVTSFLHQGTNDLRLNYGYDRNDDCLSLIVAIIDLPMGAAPRNEPPQLQCMPPISLEKPGPVDLTVELQDPDGDAMTLQLLIDGQLVRTETIGPAPGPQNRTFSAEFGPGDHVVTFRLSDGMTEVQCTTSVTVRDNHVPNLVCPGIMTIAREGEMDMHLTLEDADGDPLTLEMRIDGELIATELIPGGGNVPTMAERTVTHAFGWGEHEIVFRVSDGQGAIECSTRVLVEDDEPPTIECPPEVTEEATVACSALVTYEVAVHDNASTPTLTCRPPSGTLFPVGTTHVTCVAQDAAGLTATCGFDVTVLPPADGGLLLHKTASRLSAGLGEPVTYIYEAINTGCAPLTGLKIVDDNGTPSLAADDFVVIEGVTLAPQQTRVFTRTVRLPITIVDPNTGRETGTLVSEVLPDGNIKTLFLQSLDVNDNTYGVNAVGWPKGHKFSNLTGSDQATFSFQDSTGREVLAFQLDYISSSSKFPSGYGTLGVTGGDGSVDTGNAAHVLSYTTSLTENLNKEPFLSQLAKYTLNSPAPSDPNSALWENRMIYSVVVSKNAFGTAGFGHVALVDQHNSPAKISSFTPTPIDTHVTNVARATALVQGQIVETSASAVVQIEATLNLIADSDHDGLADSWEQTHFGTLGGNGLDDADGDGFSDLAEFLAGTSPKSAADRLAILSVIGEGGNGMRITWTSVPGKAYRLQTKTEMQSAWEDLPGVVVGAGPTAWLLDPEAGHVGLRFYRVVLIP